MSETQSSENWTIGGGRSDAGVSAPVVGSQYFSSTSSEWQPTELKGFWMKPLFENRELGEKTMLMKVDAGAFAPSHNHDGEFEQIYVIEGSFYDQNGTMKAGDYCCRAPDAPHTSGSVDGAVVMLIYTKRESGRHQSFDGCDGAGTNSPIVFCGR